jgi:hypothetical protein
MKIFLCV